jgi:hypothetical protein
MMTLTVRTVTNQDFDAIWDIFHRVVATGDTYAFSPNTTKDQAYSYWMPPQKKTYVATINDEVVGTYFIRDNMPGLASHIANAAYMVHPDEFVDGHQLLKDFWLEVDKTLCALGIEEELS